MRLRVLHSVCALKHARGCTCPSVTSVPSAILYLRLLQTVHAPVCRRLQTFDVADGRLLSSLPLASDQWPAPAWAGSVKMTIAVTVSWETHWSGSPQSHDRGHMIEENQT